MLLNMPRVSIKEIASKCGYNEETSFRRAFIQNTGRTPLDYKRWINGRFRA
jgi:transcriptional regulator GlxA family with amidase domain